MYCECPCSYCCDCNDDYSYDWTPGDGPPATPSSFSIILKAMYPVSKLEDITTKDKPFLRLLKNG